MLESTWEGALTSILLDKLAEAGGSLSILDEDAWPEFDMFLELLGPLIELLLIDWELFDLSKFWAGA